MDLSVASRSALHDERGKLIAELKACACSRDLERGTRLHRAAIQSGVDSYIFIANTLINMYAKCGSIDNARKVFDGLRHPDVVSWTALILGYAENGQGATCLDLFARMKREGECEPNARTFVAAVKACTELALRGENAAIQFGQAVHMLALRKGCGPNVYLQSILVDMYAKCRGMAEAHRVFDQMRNPDVVCWTALILGYANNGQGEIALDLFRQMERQGFVPDSRTLVAVVKACAVQNKWSSIQKGRALWLLASRIGCDCCIYVLNTLVNLYVHCGSMEDARKVFNTTKHADVLCWNALLLGYAENGEGEAVLKLYLRMKSQGCTPDAFTYSAVVTACGMVGALELGKAVHAEINRRGLLENNAVLANAVLDFYGKCGSLFEAQQAFGSHTNRNLVTWNSLMAAYSSHGESQRVLELFKELLGAGFKPDGITFNCVLTACSHAGFVEKAKDHFEEMVTKYGIHPDVCHHNCMINLLGRSNKLDDAMALLRSMPSSTNNASWMTLLAACRRWKNARLGRLAFESLEHVDETSSGAYVLMANLFGTKAGRSKSSQSWWTNQMGLVHTFAID